MAREAPRCVVALPARAPLAAPAAVGGCWCEVEEDFGTSAAATRRRRCRQTAAPEGGAACCRARAAAQPCPSGAYVAGCRRPRAPTAPKRRRRSTRPACCRRFWLHLSASPVRLVDGKGRGRVITREIISKCRNKYKNGDEKRQQTHSDDS